MFLSDDELRELTGRIQHAAQRKVLSFLSIEHRTRPDGSVVVLRQHAEQQLSGGSSLKRPNSSPEINWRGVNGQAKK